MKNFGKSQALHAGFAKAKGEVIITMDADLQDSPEFQAIQYDYLPKL
jgi:glycosyltransferase involved in cell wall biosynthesis